MFDKIMPKNFAFFDLFDQHAACTLKAVKALQNGMLNLQEIDRQKLMYEIEEMEHECDEIAHRTVDLLRHSFITPFEREEIRELIKTLDDIIDYIDAAAHRLVLFEVTHPPAEMIEICSVLVLAQEQVLILVKQLRYAREKKAQDYQAHCREINRLENLSDKYHRTGIAALFKDSADPLRVIKLKEIFEMLETAVDQCEDVANVIEGIFIEHAG